MIRAFVCAFLLLMLTAAAQAAPSCSVPRFRTLNNQTVDGYMSVKSGKSCSIILGSSRGPTFSVQIVAQPSHGAIKLVAPHRVIYQSRAGYIGSDTFTYARHGLDTGNNSVTRTVRIAVTVTP